MTNMIHDPVHQTFHEHTVLVRLYNKHRRSQGVQWVYLHPLRAVEKI